MPAFQHEIVECGCNALHKPLRRFTAAGLSQFEQGIVGATTPEHIAEERVETPGGPVRTVRNLANVEENTREYLRTAPNIANRDGLLALLEEIL